MLELHELRFKFYSNSTSGWECILLYARDMTTWGYHNGKSGSIPTELSSKQTNLMRQVQWANSKRTDQKRCLNTNGRSRIKQDSHCGTLLSLPCTSEVLTEGTCTFSKSLRERTGVPTLPEITGKTSCVHVPIWIFLGKEPRDNHTRRAGNRFILPSYSQSHAKFSEYTLIIWSMLCSKNAFLNITTFQMN